MKPKAVARPNPDLVGCKLSRDNEPGAVFTHDSGRSVRVKEDSDALYSGSKMRVDQLNEGTVATVRLGTGNAPNSIQVTYLLERKGQYDLYREGVTVFSQWKFSTDFLVWEKATNPSTKQAASVVAAKCPAIRKVSSQDNKGLWTALGLAYLEHISLHIGDEDFTYFWTLLGNSGLSQDASIFGYLKELWEVRIKGHAGNVIDTWFENQSFQEELVRVVKHLTIHYVKQHPDHEDLNFFEGGVAGFETDVKFGQEVSEPMIGFAALALSVRLIMYTLDPTQLRKGYGGDPSHPKQARIHLLRQYETFYILYSKPFLEVEGYILGQGRSSSRITQGTYDCLYFTPKNDKIQLQGSASIEEYNQATAAFAHKAQLIGGIEAAIVCLFETLKAQPLPGDLKFFNSQLLNDTYLLRAFYQKSLAKMNTLPESVWPAAEPLLVLKRSGVLEDLSVMQMCDKCQSEVGETQLECGHYICRNCFAAKVAEVRALKGYAVDPSGEAVDDLICPILGCTHFEKVSGKSLQILLGDTLEGYQLEAEQVVGTRKCTRCTKVYNHGYFLQFPICGCRLCAYCEAEILQSKIFVCLCGYDFAESTRYSIDNMEQLCIQCTQTKSLRKGFTSVRCSDHIFCIKCLEGIMKQPEPRCPQDHRRFAQFEIEAAEKQMKQPCLFCGRMLSSSEALPLDCDCCYCENCGMHIVKEKVKGMQQISQCFSCGRPFPKALLDKYTEIVKQSDFMNYTVRVTIGGLGHYKAVQCPICQSFIGRDKNITLTCNHSFHKDCIRDQAEAHTDAVVKGPIQCVQCPTPITQICTTKMGGVMRHLAHFGPGLLCSGEEFCWPWP